MTKHTHSSPWQDPNEALEAAKYQNPIPSRLLILQTVAHCTNHAHATTLEALAAYFNIIDDDDKFFALNNRLKAMLRDGQLERLDGLHYSVSSLPNTLSGKVISNPKDFGFLATNDGGADLFLHAKQMRLVFHGDSVNAITSEYRGKTEARITEVTARHQNEFIGTLAQDGDNFFVKLDGVNAHQPIGLGNDDPKLLQMPLGTALKVAIIDWPTYSHFATGKITQVLSAHNDRELIIETALSNYAIPAEFSLASLQQADSYGEPADTDWHGRTDLRTMALVTIDGEDARDFDDAVFAEKRAGGNFRLVVAIADVSHYVQEGSALDQDAYERGTSVYFPHQVIPMLPEVLSNGLCSLNPKADRLCMVADMKVSRGGRVTDCVFYPAVMHSKARLTYNQVNAYFNDPSNDSLPDDLTQNADVAKSLDTLYQLYDVLAEKRQERGAMAFETAESEIKFGADGDIIGINKRTRGTAHKLIEECMLLANTCAADFALAHDLPVLYRNHERPDETKATRLANYVKTFGLFFPNESPSHADYARIIDATKDRPDAVSIHSMLLRSMMQANYSPSNIGHFGLAYDKYSHFTSPIRRYPDLMLHRAIKDHILKQSPAAPLYKTLGEAGQQTSTTERRAEEASRFVESWLKCHYMTRRIGDEFAGVVSGVTKFGLFVSLQELFIDGLVHITNLGDEYFTFDEERQRLIGDQGASFGMGDSLVVKVAGVNMDLLQIDFLPVWSTKKRRSKKKS